MLVLVLQILKLDLTYINSEKNGKTISKLSWWLEKLVAIYHNLSIDF